MHRKKIFFSVLLTLSLQAQPSTLSLDQLHTIGAAFNIEGGNPFLKLNDHQIWLNLAIVLDRPLLDGKTLHEITAKNPFPLKESSIDIYNEARVNLAFLLVTLHCIKHGHRMVHKSRDQNVRIVVYIHRNSSGKKQAKLFQQLLEAALPETAIIKNTEQDSNNPSFLCSWYFPTYNTTLEFRIGYEDYMIGNFADSDIIFSFSLVGGLEPNFISGSLLIPQQFIPYDIDNQTVYKNKSYLVKNYLTQALPEILAQSEREKLVDLINKTPDFNSPNQMKKSLLAYNLQESDFHTATIFQIPHNFNPTDKEQVITIVD